MKLNITKTVHFATFGDKSTAQTLWIALHGYGQLSKYFIRNFHCLDEADNFVVAPEGMHRFYLNGTSGRVGASWMTKEERLDDIQDNIAYLNQLLDKVNSPNFNKIIVLGFSQGAATAARWIEAQKVKPTAFVMWAGVFPPDVQPENHRKIFGNIPLYFVVGDEDEYFSKENIKAVQNDFIAKSMQVNWSHFEGKHQILSKPLLKLEKQIVKIKL